MAVQRRSLVCDAGRKVQTLKELDQNASLIDVASSRVRGLAATGVCFSPSSSHAVLLLSLQQVGIDLSLLTAVMCPIEALEEPDEPWEFDRLLQVCSSYILMQLVCAGSKPTLMPSCLLLQEVSQALQAEADQKEAEEGGGAGGGGSASGSGSSGGIGMGSTVFL